MSPNGYVYSYKRYYLGVESQPSANGLMVAGTVEAHTAAVTGTMSTDQPFRLIAGLRVTAESTDDRLGSVVLSTVTDADGTFAFVNMPVAGGGSCYVVSARWHNRLYVRYAMWFTPEPFVWAPLVDSPTSFLKRVGSDSEQCTP
jgi:hypothetical protein